ncbi:MAG: XRE family transcriptional regulator [Sphingobacteriales bacterium]|nr:MAG: XRE family transcriptional regulator [Sphingobacteriales bacterium]
MKKLGQNIRKLRELRNFTQQYMAEKLEMTQGNYARIENEEIHLSEERLQKISGLLGYSSEFIIQFDVEKIHDMVSEKKDTVREVFQFQISPELKQLYESRINSLESYVDELKAEIRNLREQTMRISQMQQAPAAASVEEPAQQPTA